MLHLDDHPTRAALQRVLTSRSIEGLVLLPLPQPSDLDGLLDWGKFSTVCADRVGAAAELSRRHPAPFRQHAARLPEPARGRAPPHRPGAFGGLGCARASPLGRGHEWHNAHGGAERVRPFIGRNPGPNVDAGEVRKWLEREKPDAVIADSMNLRLLDELALELPASHRPIVATMNWVPASDRPGINQRVETMGMSALDLLASMVLHGEKGVPATSNTIMVAGEWRSVRISAPSANAG